MDHLDSAGDIPLPAEPLAPGFAPEPSRAAGLALLQEFTPRMGRRYAADRNYDRGPGAHGAVSQLSAHIRRRLITEQETVAEAVAAHGLSGAQKFVQEVFWRGYFKGWLERRPEVWASYRQGLAADHACLCEDADLARRVHDAEQGETGVACFDAWSRELGETGYLHNHSRMWFASIWIFTLRLPWRLGADFFYRRLLDGDPASNTLSWRWVGGLHTRGKAYAARSWNIAKYTGQRFQPSAGTLNEDVTPLEEAADHPPARPLRSLPEFEPLWPSALLITEEDCRLDELIDDPTRFRAAATVTGSHLRSRAPVSDIVAGFENGALADTAARFQSLGAPTASALVASDPAILADWARGVGATQIVTAYAPVGPLRDWLDRAEPALARNGVALVELRRAWDAQIWRHATAGFFKVKAQIPKILAHLEGDGLV